MLVFSIIVKKIFVLVSNIKRIYIKRKRDEKRCIDVISLYNSFNITLWFKCDSEFCALELNDNLEDYKLSYSLENEEQNERIREEQREIFELGKLEASNPFHFPRREIPVQKGWEV